MNIQKISNNIRQDQLSFIATSKELKLDEHQFQTVFGFLYILQRMKITQWHIQISKLKDHLQFALSLQFLGAFPFVLSDVDHFVSFLQIAY